MIKSAVTICLVPEAQGGPFVFWDDLGAACRKAAGLGFHAIEIFPPSPSAISPDLVKPLLERHGLAVAAVGTGAGWVKHRLSLTSPQSAERREARDFVRSMIDAAAALGAPAIVGSMQGRWGGDAGKDAARGYLAEALHELGEHAARHNLPLLFEPLNRYETNMANTVHAAVLLVQWLAGGNVKVLADLFHMNIEERDIAAALRDARGHIGHVHLADSNRCAAGMGHTDFAPISAALYSTHYTGYVSAEALPFPSPEIAADATMRAYQQYFQAPHFVPDPAA
jgi:sugar phosphate isomerase/epimerase